MSRSALLCFKDLSNKINGAYIESNGSYNEIGSRFVQAYLNNDKHDINECLDMISWVDIPNLETLSFNEAKKVAIKKDNIDGKGHQILSLLESKDVITASKVYQPLKKYHHLSSGPVIDFEYRGYLHIISIEDNMHNNIITDDKGNKKLQLANKYDGFYDDIDYIYLYDMNEDSLNLYEFEHISICKDLSSAITSNRSANMVFSKKLNINRTMNVHDILNVIPSLRLTPEQVEEDRLRTEEFNKIMSNTKKLA
ncbi:hypothetical protein NNC19_16145 [Clostridium sp. SHJSY1]|uniref:hypothetical protein n=1 Tax=Clostridium sp. SHJSY1 TaxID=2942483 RepID=UPI002874286F|nr:hypothetical protein [Clostridium sp. SHJSY1]MDS0527224.1 hypothetical protein [Clostridium sp. SHJSY1]